MGFFWGKMLSCIVKQCSLCYFLIFSYCHVKPVICEQEQEASQNETLLLDNLFKAYNRNTRPVTISNETVEIMLRFQLVSIQELSTTAQQINIVGWIDCHWYDKRLRWNQSEFDIESLVLPPSLVWLPSLLLLNTISVSLYNSDWKALYEVLLFHDGRIYWVPAGSFQVYCDMDLRYFPFDEQTCDFRFGNFMYTNQQIDLQILSSADDYILKYYSPNAEWNIVNASFNREIINSQFPVITLKLHVQRKTLFYVVNIVVVTLFLAVLLLSVFQLPVESGICN